MYKITFVNNEAVSCTHAPERSIQKPFVYEHHNSFLIYALVEAADEREAMNMVPQIVEDFMEKHP